MSLSKIQKKSRAWDRLTSKIEKIESDTKFDDYDDPQEAMNKEICKALDSALFVYKKSTKNKIVSFKQQRRYA